MSGPDHLLLHYRPKRRLLGGYRTVLVTPEPDPGTRREPGSDAGARRPPRTAWTVLLPVLAGAVLGIAAGLAPLPVALALTGSAVLVGLLLHLEWAALAVVAASVFEDYLARLDPRATKLLAVVLVVAWVIWRCSTPRRDRPRSPVLGAAAALAATIAASTVLHNNGEAGIAVVVRYAGFLALLLVLGDAVRDLLTPRRLARAYVLACSVAAACGTAAFVLADDRRVGGPIGDPNDLAFFLLPAVALGPAVRGDGRHRWLWDVATVVVAVGIAGTLSRGAFVGLAGMLLFVLLTGMVRARVLVGLVAAGAAAVLVVVAAVPGLVSTSLQQKGVVADQNVSERLDLWSAAAQMTVEHPVLGLGPGAFSQQHQLYASSLPDDVNHPLDVAHNTWLEVSSELGLLGLAAFVALLALAFTEARRAWRRSGDPVAAAVCAGLVAAVLAASFVTEQYYLPFWLLAVLAIGVADRADTAVPDEPVEPVETGEGTS